MHFTENALIHSGQSSRWDSPGLRKLSIVTVCRIGLQSLPPDEIGGATGFQELESIVPMC